MKDCAFLISTYLFETESLSRRLGYSSTIIAHCNLELLGSSDPLASAFQVAETTSVYHDAQLILKFFVETESCYVAQAGLQLLASRDYPILAFQSTEISGISHSSWPLKTLLKWMYF
uniref:Uncharacterized protein n=1 Tax=Papio anubis TaxID=9555 RepID=A0A8I5NSY2_PAPAN